MALQKLNISIPVSGGLDTKTDSKQVMAGNALALENARFQKTGKLSKRFGLVKLSVTTNNNNLDDFTTSAVVSDNDYMAAVTSDGIYGYSDGDASWYKQSVFNTSAKIKTSYVCKNHLDQRAPDSDITADGTHIAYVSNQGKVGNTSLKNCLLVLEDTSTGLSKSITVNTSTGSLYVGLQRVLVVKEAGTLKVHLFVLNNSNIERYIYDKNLSLISTTTIVSAVSTSQFDICKDESAIYFARITTTNLELRSYDFGGTLIATNSDTLTNGISIAAGAAAGMSITTTNSNLHISWLTNGGRALKGFTKGLVLAVAELSASGALDYKKISICANSSGITVVYSFGATTKQTVWERYIFAATYTLGSTGTFFRLFLASQVFTYRNKDHVVLRSVEVGNNSLYLMNISDGYMAQTFSPALVPFADLFPNNEPVNMISKTTVLSGVVYTSATRSFRIDSSEDNGDHFGAVGLTRLRLDFNYNYKDFSRQRIGPRIYLTSGSTIEVDKENPHENGFMMSPIIDSVTAVVGVADPNVSSRTFSYCAVYEYYDSSGQITRSKPSPFFTITATPANTAYISVVSVVPVGSLKFISSSSARPMSIVIYRTENNGSVMYRIAEDIISTNNGFIGSAHPDTAADATIINNERLYTTGGVLQNDPAPTALSSFSGGNRMFLVGLEESDEIAYSKKQLFGESVAFSDFFRIRVSTGSNADKTPINSGGYLDGKVVVFRENSIAFFTGDGPLETGVQDSFTEPEAIATDVGCTDPRSVLNTPVGIMFKSKKGIYLLDRSLQVSYRGKEVEDFNSEHIVASLLSDKYNEARFYTTAGNCLVFNYLFETWSVFKNQTIVDADTWQGSPVSILSNAVFKETENTFLDNAAYYAMKFTSPWLKIADVQGYQRCYQIWIIGEFKSVHTLKCRIYTDYNDSTYEDYSLVYDATHGNQYQFSVSIPNQKVESIKFEIYDSAQSGTGESYALSNLMAEVGIKTGGYKLAATKSY